MWKSNRTIKNDTERKKERKMILHKDTECKQLTGQIYTDINERLGRKRDLRRLPKILQPSTAQITKCVCVGWEREREGERCGKHRHF